MSQLELVLDDEIKDKETLESKTLPLIEEQNEIERKMAGIESQKEGRCAGKVK